MVAHGSVLDVRYRLFHNKGCQAPDPIIPRKINDIHVPNHLADSAMLNYRDEKGSPGHKAGVFLLRS